MARRSPDARGGGDLAAYNAKRDFSKTKEPAGKKPTGAKSAVAKPTKKKQAAKTKSKLDRFVVHEHHARRLHWDLRLERDGVLASWAIPNGIPDDPKENRLAVHVEDHPLDYIDFEGEIPAGSYGAGQVYIWDEGTYECEKFRDNEVMVVFKGKRLKGRYVLFPTRGNDWMIHRMDPPERERDPMPEQLLPMTAVNRRKAPAGDEWAFEVMWDGLRAIFHWRPGRVRVTGAEGEDLTATFPELRPLGRSLASRDAILDGEVCALGADGRPDPERLAARAALTSDSAIRRNAERAPLAYVIYDLLYLDGEDLMGIAYERRRQLLAGLELAGNAWQTPAHHTGDGDAVARAAAGMGLPGIVAKRLDSVYRPGKSVQAWQAVRS